MFTVSLTAPPSIHPLQQFAAIWPPI